MIINKPTSIFYNRHYAAFVLSIALSFFLFTSVQAKEKVVWQSGYDYVAIVPIDSPDYKSNDHNDHPVQLSPQEIYTILSSIHTEVDEGLFNIDMFNPLSDDEDEVDAYFNSKTGSNENGELAIPHRPLFNESELRKISEPISSALSEIQADKDIVFSVSGRHEGVVGKSQLSTTARLFYKDKQLNIIFGEIYVDIKQKYHRSGGTTQVPSRAESYKLKSFRLKTGAREKKSKLPFEFITGKAHSLNISKGKKRKDWLKVDFQVLTSELDKAKKNSTENKKTAQDQEQLKRKVDRLERLMRAREKAIANKPAQQPISTKPQKSLEERLSELKQLYSKGVISDEVYNEKAKKLLDEL